MSGTGAVTLNGRGTVVMAGTNTHSGAITIGAGTLLIRGVTGTSPLTAAGGTITGDGRVAGPVVIGAGGTLAPGTSIGTLTIGSSLTLQAGGVMSVEVSKTARTNDMVIGLTEEQLPPRDT